MNNYRVRFHCPVTLRRTGSVDFDAKSDTHAQQRVPSIAAEANRTGSAGRLERLAPKTCLATEVCTFQSIEELR